MGLCQVATQIELDLLVINKQSDQRFRCLIFHFLIGGHEHITRQALLRGNLHPMNPVLVEFYGVSGNEDRTQKASLTRSEEHTSELQSRPHLVCRLLLEKKKIIVA